ncbi:MAG: hypothetical protein ABJN36_00525 [Cyclobacteriaceae bacterium]
MKLSVFLRSVFLIAITICARYSYAQNSTDSTRNSVKWVNVGLGGFSTTENISGVGFELSWNVRDENSLKKYRLLVNSEFDLFGPTPSESYTSFAMLFGAPLDVTDGLKVFASVGGGLTYGVRRGDFKYSTGSIFGTDHYEKERFVSPVISFEAGFTVQPKRIPVGIGTTAYADLIFYRPLLGLSLVLIVGNTRTGTLK